jgi:hypothetical protein
MSGSAEYLLAFQEGPYFIEWVDLLGHFYNCAY